MRRWNVMCNVEKIIVNVDKYMGELYTPELNYPDMSSTIKCFKNIDPEIKRIDVYVGEQPDMSYVKETDGGWMALRWENVDELHSL